MQQVFRLCTLLRTGGASCETLSRVALRGLVARLGELSAGEF